MCAYRLRYQDGRLYSKNAIESIDFLKIDVEGANCEVLVGFGNELSRVKSIQIEGECLPYWEGQKPYKDIEVLLKQNDFELVYFLLSPGGVQSDSFWIQRRYIARSISDENSLVSQRLEQILLNRIIR